MSIVRIVGLIAVACGFAACTFILCAFLNLRIECTAYSAEKDTQMELIDKIARQVPNPSFQQEGSLALSLHNVWGNTMPIECQCPHCGRFYDLSDDWAGRTASCKCGHQLVVPEAVYDLAAFEEPEQTVSASAPADDAPDLQQPASEARPRKYPKGLTAALGVMAGFVVLGLVVAAMLPLIQIMLSEAGIAPKETRIVLSHKKPLQEQRAGFETKIVSEPLESAVAPPQPPPENFRTVKYPSPVGPLPAYLTPDPGDGVMRPAIVWAHGNLEGLKPELWATPSEHYSDSIAGLLVEDIVVICPSFRWQNGNPGRFEMFYGEVDDLIAAGRYAASLPYVDADRIYVAGIGYGATLALLSAAAESPFRAAFAIDAVLEIDTLLEAEAANSIVPFDLNDAKESDLRNPSDMVAAIRIPTICFVGGDTSDATHARSLERYARNEGAPLRCVLVTGGASDNMSRPLLPLILNQVRRDTTAEPSVAISETTANNAHVRFWDDYRRREREYFDSQPDVIATEAAVKILKARLDLFELEAGEDYSVLMIINENGVEKMQVEKSSQLPSEDYVEVFQDDIRFVFSRTGRRYTTGIMIDWNGKTLVCTPQQFLD